MSNKTELLQKLKAFGMSPAAGLKDITAPPGADNVNSPAAPETGFKPQENDGSPTLTREAALSMADSAKINDFSASPATPESPTSPGTINPGEGATFNAPSVSGVALGNVVGGKTATELMDVLFPSLAVLAASYLGYQIRRTELQLSAKEKDVITPVFQVYLDSLRVDFNNPLYNLLFVVSVVYGSKVIEKLPEFEKSKPKEERAKDKVEKQVENIKKAPDLDETTRKLKEIAAKKKISFKAVQDMYRKGAIKLD